jgi:hypothetical protein
MISLGSLDSLAWDVVRSTHTFYVLVVSRPVERLFAKAEATHVVAHVFVVVLRRFDLNKTRLC